MHILANHCVVNVLVQTSSSSSSSFPHRFNKRLLQICLFHLEALLIESCRRQQLWPAGRERLGGHFQSSSSWPQLLPRPHTLGWCSTLVIYWLCSCTYYREKKRMEETALNTLRSRDLYRYYIYYIICMYLEMFLCPPMCRNWSKKIDWRLIVRLSYESGWAFLPCTFTWKRRLVASILEVDHVLPPSCAHLLARPTTSRPKCL